MMSEMHGMQGEGRSMRQAAHEPASKRQRKAKKDKKTEARHRCTSCREAGRSHAGSSVLRSIAALVNGCAGSFQGHSGGEHQQAADEAVPGPERIRIQYPQPHCRTQHQPSATAPQRVSHTFTQRTPTLDKANTQRDNGPKPRTLTHKERDPGSRKH